MNVQQGTNILECAQLLIDSIMQANQDQRSVYLNISTERVAELIRIWCRIHSEAVSRIRFPLYTYNTVKFNFLG